ncbi:MAG TPA: PIG-L family deacetylase, partial [Longimicrobiaceae bacterium]|nr:PIG-L family deacetylase [Longimicrobiaceae bacterium]
MGPSTRVGAIHALRCRGGTLAALAGIAAVLSACERSLPSATAGPQPEDGPRHATTAAAPSVEFYIHAHQDDWQLFMGDRVAASLGTADKVVLVYTTAGDAGDGAPYWQRREAASKASVDSILATGTWACAGQAIRGHPIARCTKGKVVSYYLRLPDGNYLDGTGYGFGSLARLRDQGTATAARDGSTTYTSWADFHGTLAGIVEFEAAGRDAWSIAVHAPDYDRNVNRDDHPDHYATADAARAAVSGRDWNEAWYQDYGSETSPVNLSTSAHAVKHKVFAAYDRIMAAAGYESLIGRPRFQGWLWRTYFRAVTVTPPPPPPPP